MIISVAAMVEDLIAHGRAAHRKGDVAAARSLFQTALTLGPNSATLEGLGFAAYLAMEFDEAIDLWQQPYAGYRADGNGVGAVRRARMLGYLYGIVVGDWAIGPGWIARAPAPCMGLPRIRRREAGSTQLATLQPPPPEMQQLLGAIQGNQQAMDDFISVNAGTLSPEVFFSPEHLARTFEAAAISV